MARRVAWAVGVVGLALGIAVRADVSSSPILVTGVAVNGVVAGESAAPPVPDGVATLIDDFCLGCHDAAGKTAGLDLENFDVAKPEADGETAEKVIRKLRAGMMPPSTEPQPDAATLGAFITTLESRLDKVAASRINPGRRPFQRLNRAEYEHAIHDMLDLSVDVEAFLPPDTISAGFDNVADVQGFSPSLMEGYMRAARRISLDAVGDPRATPTSVPYKIPRTTNQTFHIEGTPFGSRGGTAVVHNFPADGEYQFKIMLHSIPTGQLFGSTARGEQVEVSVNGARVALIDINPRMSEGDPNGMWLETPRIAVKAGPQRVAASFIRRFDGPIDDLIRPIEHTLADTQIGSAQGITTVPHLREFVVAGPYTVTGVSDTPSRRKVFVCRPTAAAEEEACAARIVSELARRAYRRPVTQADLQGLMGFYNAGRKDADFESGVRVAVQAILASPHFLFRMEEPPANARPGQNYRISDIDLASRLSFFLWSTGPDESLLKAAETGALRTPAVFDQQVRRMLADPRAAALAVRFAGQWLRLQDLEGMHPDALLYPQYDHSLGQLMHRETELFFASIVREDRDVLDLLTADYTFVNERLAKHYGLTGVAGSNFRRVPLPDVNRRGILGQGSMLVQTSVADRTSPVMRGKWVMEVLLGTPPPPPPPVPAFEESVAIKGGRRLTVRERMEEHRKNPSCMSCHRMIDPIGLALENFDPTGAWRIKDNGAPVDPVSTMYDGEPIDGPESLRRALLKHSDVVLRNFTANLMVYGLGRRVEYYDMSAVRAIVRDAEKQGNRFSAFVLGIIKTPAFQMSRAEAETEAGSGRGLSGPK